MLAMDGEDDIPDRRGVVLAARSDGYVGTSVPIEISPRRSRPSSASSRRRPAAVLAMQQAQPSSPKRARRGGTARRGPHSASPCCRCRGAMTDAEIQAVLQDPKVRQVIQDTTGGVAGGYGGRCGPACAPESRDGAGVLQKGGDRISACADKANKKTADLHIDEGSGRGRGVECLCLGLLVLAAAARVLLGRLVGAPHRRAAVGRRERAHQSGDRGERGVVREREARAPPRGRALLRRHVALVHAFRRFDTRNNAQRAGLVVLEAVPVLAEVVVVVPPLLAIVVEPLVVVPVAQGFGASRRRRRRRP